MHRHNTLWVAARTIGLTALVGAFLGGPFVASVSAQPGSGISVEEEEDKEPSLEPQIDENGFEKEDAAVSNGPDGTEDEWTDGNEEAEVQYGGSVRLRWVSIPSSVLGVFTEHNSPLSSYHAGVEFIRRKGDLDITFGWAYQGMSPPDANWLGKGKDPGVDTDYVQVKKQAMITVADVAFVWNTFFNDFIGIRYGAGLGLGILTGKVLRTPTIGANGQPCTAENAGNEAECRPVPCPDPAIPCTESALQASMGSKGTGRYRENDIPGAIPIINFVFGPVLRIPDLPGFELRAEAGFYNAFFTGISLTYLR